MNSLKTRLDNLDVDKLKIVPMDVEQLSDVVSKKVFKNPKFKQFRNWEFKII